MHELLHGYPVIIEIPVAWGEMDAFQHVNNTVYFRYFESARIAYLQQCGWADPAAHGGIGPILAAASCRFKFPLTFPDTVQVGASVGELGEDRLTMHYRVVSLRYQRIAADGDSVIVSYNYSTNLKAPLPTEVRAAIEALENRG